MSVNLRAVGQVDLASLFPPQVDKGDRHDTGSPIPSTNDLEVHVIPHVNTGDLLEGSQHETKLKKEGSDSWGQTWDDDWDAVKEPQGILSPSSSDYASSSSVSSPAVHISTPHAADPHTKKLSDWSQHGQMAISYYGNMLSLADESRLGIFKLNAAEVFENHATLEDCETREKITQTMWLALESLPSQKKDWSKAGLTQCIIVGYSTGRIKVYTEDGDLLITQRLHPEPVLHFTLQTNVNSEGITGTELMIVSHRTVVVVDGNTLDNPGLGMNECDISPPSLAYRKYILDEQGYTSDVISTVGKHPFIGLFSTNSKPPLFSAVNLASSVASTVATAVFSVAKFWWSTPQPEQEQTHDHFEAPTVISLKDSLTDGERMGQSITVDPTGRYGAITDGYGRILLMDLGHLLILRMWKGYRHAQCGWIKSVEETNEGRKIWCLWPTPSRVQAYNVGPNARLLYNNHNTLGLSLGSTNSGTTGQSDAIANQPEVSSTQPLDDCFLLRQGLGVIAISVPFKCAISESKADKNINAVNLQRIRELVIGDFTCDQIQDRVIGEELDWSKDAQTCLDLLADMDSTSIKLLALDAIGVDNASVEFLLVATKSVLESLPMEPGDKSTRQLLNGRINLLQGYQSLVHIKLGDGRDQPMITGEPIDMSVLKMTESDVTLYTNLIGSTPLLECSCFPLAVLSPAAFLRCFVITGQDSVPLANLTAVTEGREGVEWIDKIDKLDSEDEMNVIACFVFQCMILDQCPIAEVIGALSGMGLQSESIMRLLMCFVNQVLPIRMIISKPIIDNIHSLVGQLSEGTTMGLNNWWTLYQSCLATTPYIYNALIMSLIGRCHASTDSHWPTLVDRLTDLCMLANGNDHLLLPPSTNHHSVTTFQSTYSIAEALAIKAIQLDTSPYLMSTLLADEPYDDAIQSPSSEFRTTCGYFRDRVNYDDVVIHCTLKVGKAAKDRLCIKHLGLNKKCTEHWLLFVVNTLVAMEKAIGKSLEDVPDRSEEKNASCASSSDWIQSLPPTIPTGSLKDVTKRRPIILDYVNITSALFLIFAVEIRQQPMKLFLEIIRKNLCLPSLLYDEGKLFNQIDQLDKDHHIMEALTSRRLQFISKVVASNCNPPHSPASARLIKVATRLAQWFLLEEDCVRKAHILWLYKESEDDWAQEQLNLLKHPSVMADELFAVVGRRLASQWLGEKEPEDDVIATQKAELLVNLPAEISDWLQDESKNAIGYKECSIKATQNLLNKAISLMSTDSPL
eukprot:Ihof_evm1s554 gene=Ihof_evmTU1s554